jgi:L-fuculose-phosphate aldolase
MDALESELREELIEITNRLSTRGLIRGSGGNLSVRLNADEILITPTQLPKGYLREKDIVVIDSRGELLRGERPPSLETQFHLAAYETRPDAEAVVHAHPMITTAFTVAGKTIPAGVLPEFEILFPDGVPTVPYETPATRDLADVCREYIANYDIIVLSYHGTLAVGHSLTMAWMTTEHLETCMEVLFYAECLGGAQPLPEARVKLLREIHKRITAYGDN